MTGGTVQLAGRSVVVRESQRPLKSVNGYCQRGKKGQPDLIVISKGLTVCKQLEILIHEMDHLQYWMLTEEVVDAAAKEKSDALERLGVV